MADENSRGGLKALLSFLLLTAAAVTLFYFGWVQFDLPENTYAVLFSKTGGYDKEVLKPGEFNWRWEKILPTNSELVKIRLTNRTVTLDFEGALPSGDLYGSTLPEQPDFSYHMTFQLIYRIREEKLPELLEKKILEGGDLEPFYLQRETEYMEILKDGTADFFTQNLAIDNSSYDELENLLLNRINSLYSYLEVRSFSIRYINYPDLELYSKSRDLYHQIVDRKKETEMAMEKWAIESKVNLDTKIEILSRYGELLSKYPILVDYFALDPESQALDISNLKDYSHTSNGGD